MKIKLSTKTTLNKQTLIQLSGSKKLQINKGEVDCTSCGQSCWETCISIA